MPTKRLIIQKEDYNGKAALRLNKLSIHFEANKEHIVIKGMMIIEPNLGSKPEVIIENNGKQIPVILKKSPMFRKKFRGWSNSGFARVGISGLKMGAEPATIKARKNKDAEWVNLITVIDLKYALPPTRLQSLHKAVFGGSKENIVRKKVAYFRKFKTLPFKYQIYPEYNELEAVLRILNRARLMRAMRAIKNTRNFRDETGEPQKFVEFENKMLELTDGIRPTNHGFSSGLGEISDGEKFWHHISNLTQKLEKLGYPVFLNSGTLLGYVRDGKPIEFDDDIDLAVVLKSNSIEEAAHEFLKLKDILQKENILKEDMNTKVLSNGIYKLKNFGEFEVDLFPCWVENYKVYVWPHTFGELSKDDVFPLRRTEQSGISIPKEPEKMLAVNYGENWREPDPYWSFDWGNAFKRFAKYRNIFQKQFLENDAQENKSNIVDSYTQKEPA